jgi:hypothetical protein
MNMELLGRVFAAVGISLVLTLLLLVLYQDDPQAQMQAPQTMTQMSAGVEPITTTTAATSVTVR